LPGDKKPEEEQARRFGSIQKSAELPADKLQKNKITGIVEYNLKLTSIGAF
jgi:hypothetical protein